MPISRSQLGIPQGVTFLGQLFPAPFWQAPGALLYQGDVRVCLRALPERSVHCVVTSPPYWGLRDYGTGQWEGGIAECDHEPDKSSTTSTLEGGKSTQGSAKFFRTTCPRCGARRVDQQLGMEEVADCLGWATSTRCGKCFVCHMVEVFAEVRRVLRDDGTCWLNLGDTFDGEQQMIPARVALALQADGWILRQDIIWAKPNPMAESVTNRCTKSHEHIFLLTKTQKYYFDQEPIREEVKENSTGVISVRPSGTHILHTGSKVQESRAYDVVCGANKRDVWTVSTKGYPGAHFATYNPQLITPCILAGTSEHGACAQCGVSYERVVAKERAESRVSGGGNCFGKQSGKPGADGHPSKDNYRQVIGRETLGWRKMCACAITKVVSCTVLDSFVGSGTTVATALQLGRAGIGIDLSEQYLRDHAIPRIEVVTGTRPARNTVVVPTGTCPPPQRLRGMPLPGGGAG